MGKVIKDSTGKVLLASSGAFEVTAAIDSNIVAGNIKKDVDILGVTGTYEGSGGGASTTSVYLGIYGNNCNGYYLAVDGTATQFSIDPLTMSVEFTCISGSFIYCEIDMGSVNTSTLSGATIVTSGSYGRPATTTITLLQAD